MQAVRSGTHVNMISMTLCDKMFLDKTDYQSVLKRIFFLGRIEYSNIIRIPENIRIYSNKFAKNVKVSESKIFTYPKNTFQSEKIFHILTLINKNYRSSPCSQNIVQI